MRDERLRPLRPYRHSCPCRRESPAPLSICPAPTDKQHVGETVRWDAGIDALLERTFLASTPADCEGCLPDIARALASATQPLERARLLTCRARVRSLQLHFREACDDCAAAVALFESAGADSELAVDAASLGAAHAARLNDVALASELATKSILGLDSVTDDRLRMEITNRLGVFCYYYLDYDGAVEQFEVSLAAAERVGDGERICRELYNVVDALLRAARERRMSNLGTDTERLGRAEAMARRLVADRASHRADPEHGHQAHHRSHGLRARETDPPRAQGAHGPGRRRRRRGTRHPAAARHAADDCFEYG